MSQPPEPAAVPPRAAATVRPGDPPWYTPRVELVCYVLAGVSYIGLAIFHKFLLNWIIGPVWLVAWIWAVPALLDRVRRRREPPAAGGAAG